MKKKYKKILLIVICLLLFQSFSFANELPNDAVIEYFETSLSNDSESIWNIINQDYILEHIASEEIYKAYLSSAFEVMNQNSYIINDITIIEIPDTLYAVAYVDLTSNITIIETEQTIEVTKDVVLFLEKKESGWLVNFIVDRIIFDTNQDLGLMSFYTEEVYAIESENALREINLGNIDGEILTADDVENVNNIEWANISLDTVKTEEKSQEELVQEKTQATNEIDTTIETKDNSVDDSDNKGNFKLALIIVGLVVLSLSVIIFLRKK